MVEFKTISDTIHGSIRVEGVALDLLGTPQVQRLSGIRQLGLSYLIFPGANHTRLEHSLGAHAVATRMARLLNLPRDEATLVAAAALLHDLGHGPFSHTLEGVLAARTKRDHMDITKGIILGKEDTVVEADLSPRGPSVAEMLEDHDLDGRQVADLVRGCTWDDGLEAFGSAAKGPKRYLADIIHSTVDCDQVDYLLRDAHYTGVAHGLIDHERLLQTLAIHHGALVVDQKGVTALEGMLVARALMYSAVYFHKTVRIAEVMLSRAVERAEGDMATIQSLGDAELLAWLLARGGLQRDVALRIKYRRLYKRAVQWTREELSEKEREFLLLLARDPLRRARVEDALSHRVGAPEGRVIVDVPMPELLLSEPRLHRTEVPILEDGHMGTFRRASPLARALQIRETTPFVATVSAAMPFHTSVAKVARRIVFGEVG